MKGMRALIALMSLAILAAFAAGYLALSYRLEPRMQPRLSQVGDALESFRERDRPEQIFHLDDAIATDRRETLLDPRAHLPQSARFDFAELSRLYRYAQTCASVGRAPFTGPLTKAWTWHRFLCGDRRELPKDFFSDGPAIHPSGSSYVFLAWKSGRPEFSSPEWGRTHVALAHASEYAELPSEWLDLPRQALVGLGPSGLRAVGSGERVAIAARGDRVWLRRIATGEEREAGPTYEIHSARAFRRFLRDTPFAIALVGEDSACLLRDGNACWYYNAEAVYRKASTPTLFLLGATLVLTAIFLRLLLRMLGLRRQDERRKRFALQTLTHELRTPIASLRVSAEALRARIDLMPEESQEATLRILDDLQRLSRLAEASRQYLSTSSQGDAALILLKRAPLGPLGDFVERALDPWRGEITLEKMAGAEAELVADAYWLAICVKNLATNALTHGQSPVVARVGSGPVGSGNEGWWIEVEDAGRCEVGDLQPRKPRASAGLGLGLSIVREILKEMGGRLEFLPSPTRFRLVIPVKS